MKSFWLIALPLFLVFVFVQCSHSYKPSPKNQLTGEICNYIAKKYGLIPWGVGGGTTKEGLPLIKIRFRYNGKPLNVEEGRELIIEVLKDTLEFINNKQVNSEKLKDYPFTFKNIDLSIYCHDSLGDIIFDPYLNTISTFSKDIGYFTQDPDNRYKYKQEIYETYEEAFEKVKKERNNRVGGGGGVLKLPSSHTTVRTEPYTAVHDHYDLAHTKVIIGIYPMDSISLFDIALCIP